MKTAILLAFTPRKPGPSKEKKFYMSIFTVQKRKQEGGRAEGKTGGIWVNNLL